MELIIIFVVLVLIFALIGFVSSLMWMFKSPASNLKPVVAPAPTLASDVKAARRLIAYLLNQKEIRRDQYQDIKQFLERRFTPEGFKRNVGSAGEVNQAGNLSLDAKPHLPADLASAELEPPSPLPSTKQDLSVDVVDGVKFLPARVRPTREPVPDSKSQVDDAALGQKTSSSIGPEVVDAELAVTVSGADQQGADASSSSLSANASSPSTVPLRAKGSGSGLATTAPWDLPDPPAKPPRRSFGEMMSGFMQEKNMRWGELTSGILIVLSAVGLVLSLREELRNTIPYFSALLFMLITAAIHGAGIYTLKKWKLRNTSRGTLIIGLLLVPLNFVAACILSGGEQQRSFSDPWLWIAIGVGVTAFSAMTWKSSRLLLRKFNWSLTIAIMGCGVGALVINRLAGQVSSSSGYLLYSLPVLASFLVGVCWAVPNQWSREKWSNRSSNRMFLFLGISAFALIVSLGLVLIRTESKAEGAVALTPIFSLAFLMATWIGSIISKGAIGKIQQPHRIAGLSLKILGLILTAVSLFSSLANPTVFVVNAIVSAVVLVTMFVHQREEKLLPIAWSVLAAGVLAGFNLFLGTFEFDQWASVSQLHLAVVSGKSGLCLLGVGALVVALNSGVSRLIDPDDRVAFGLRGWATGVGIFLVGCLIALVASYVNPENVFDVMTASSLLSTAGISLLLVSVFAVRKLKAAGEYRVDIWAALLVILALAHLFLWNSVFKEFVEASTGGVVGSWLVMIAAGSLLFVGVAVVLQCLALRDEGANELKKLARPTLVNYLTLGCIVTWALSIASVVLLPAQTGWATGFQVFASVGWLAAGWVAASASGLIEKLSESLHAKADDWRDFIGWPFAVSMFLLVGVAVAEFGPKLGWCPSFESPKHWLIQVCAISVWAICWMVLAVGFGATRRLSWISRSTAGLEKLVFAGLLVVIGAFVCDALVVGSVDELANNQTNLSQFSIESEMIWGYSALVALGIGVVVSLLFAPSASMGGVLALVWLLAWSLGAVWFGESKSIASAIRWLIPIGGLTFALLASTRRKLFPAWAGIRNQLSLTGPSRWDSSSSQHLINLLLAIVTLVVLAISTVTVSRVLVGGAESLGGPLGDSWFKAMGAEVSFGVPIFMVISTFLTFAISERRSGLATLGSVVLQYIVVLAVVLLFVSPHPRLASTWFLGILQAVSLAMTGYGFVWYLTKSRIERNDVGSDKSENLWFGFIKSPFSQIETHTLINGLLVSSLAALVIGRFYLFPNQAGDWVSSVGNTLGIVAWAMFGWLAYSVWNDRLMKRSVSTWSWLVGWMGLILVALVAAIVDHNFNGREGLPFQIITVGVVLVALGQFALGWFLMRGVAAKQLTEAGEIARISGGVSTSYAKAVSEAARGTWPSLLVGSIGLAFAVRGALMSIEAFWFYVAVIGLLTALAVCIGCLLRSSLLGFVSAGMTVLLTTLLCMVDPQNWFKSGSQPYWFNMVAIGLSVLAIGWSVFYIHQRNRGRQIGRAFMRMPNVVLLLGAIWIFIACGFELFLDLASINDSALLNPLGLVATASIVCFSILLVAVDRVRGQTVSWCLLSLGLLVLLATKLSPPDWSYNMAILTSSVTVAIWGVVWLNRNSIGAVARQLGAGRSLDSHLGEPVALLSLQDKAAFRLPIYSLCVGAATLLGVSWLLFDDVPRIQRYLMSLSPFALAVGFGCQSNQLSKRWLQMLTLGLVIFGSLLVGWSDLPSFDFLASEDGSRLLVRSMIVLAAAMFVYGGLVTRWVRAGDSWLKSLRQMALVTCVLAILCFALLLAVEIATFRNGGGCGLAVGEAVVVGLLVAGMIFGLIMIAVRPENDPFSLPLSGRVAYVYAAELVVCALIGHVYLTMPWLFQSVVGEYWPFVVMAICFTGVGLANLLEKRNLTVLGGPLFNTAAALPILVSVGLFLVNSRADSAVVLLAVGMVYLLIAFMKRSVLSGAAAVLFGNLALWLFFHRSPGFSFFNHPQLWLIPPAVSTLIASHLSRGVLKPGQLTAIRYVSVAVIYLSSTIEIFITGIGDNLWPPVLLAIFSVIGIMAGMMFRIKSFLYFGSLFLLMAMITMVAHAQQRLDHVWPWWAFGVALGIAILVMFGLFEKRKKEMNAIASKLKDWDA